MHVVFNIGVSGLCCIRMPRTVSWEDVMLDQTEDSVVVRLLSAGLNLAADSVVHRYVVINTSLTFLRYCMVWVLSFLYNKVKWQKWEFKTAVRHAKWSLLISTICLLFCTLVRLRWNHKHAHKLEVKKQLRY